MDEQLQQLIDRIGQAQNILVTVSASPSVDQLSAALGLTLVLNKLGKHGTAVFSGTVPSTLEFLKPEETIEKNTDSLRDFIIALDKSKADKLRYKVEDDVVRIFITPYKTSISQKDLQFSQGDFNVDVVVCLGVTEQQDLDTAITAHGRILHDATVASISTQGQGSLGSINWVDPNASSLSEMVLGLADGLDKSALDGQIATALLTGIVASTERFRNDKTTPKTMSISAELMAAGANQQLIATELEQETSPAAHADTSDSDEHETKAEPAETEPEQLKSEPGTLEIDHHPTEHDEPDDHEATTETDTASAPVDDESEPDQTDLPTISGVHAGGDDLFAAFGANAPSAEPADDADADNASDANEPTSQLATTDEPSESRHQRMTEPPQVNEGDLTANSQPEPLDPATEELSLPSLQVAPLLTHDEPHLSDTTGSVPTAAYQPAPASWQPPVSPDETLSEIEQSVASPHLQPSDPIQPAVSLPFTEPPAQTPANSVDPVAQPAAAADEEDTVDDARSAVEAALRGSAGNDPLQPIEALNAQPLGPELQPAPIAQPVTASTPPPFAPPNLPSIAPSQPTLNPVTNAGFSEPTPGNTPADETLDMPLPTSGFGGPPGSNSLMNPFGQPDVSGQPNPTALPGMPPASNDQSGGQTPPPVPPPMLPPLQ